MIDFHAHLDLYPDPAAIARECARRRLYVLSVTTTPSAWEGTMRLELPRSRIRTALGLHPQLIGERKSEIELFAKLLPKTRYVGEVGLDGGPEHRATWNDQLTVFGRVLSMCQASGGRIISIHSRRAATAVLNALEDCPGPSMPILHWFSGSARELARAIELGCWFSVGPAMLAGAKGRELVSLMPKDRLLTETDGPFAAIDEVPAMPWDVDRAVRQLSELWSVSFDEVDAQLHLNLRALTALFPAR